MGNYSLLVYMGGNIALEFFYSGPHSLISRMHLNNAHGSTIKARTGERPRTYSSCRHQPSTSGAEAGLLSSVANSVGRTVQRLFRVVRQPGHLFLASSRRQR